MRLRSHTNNTKLNTLWLWLCKHVAYKDRSYITPWCLKYCKAKYLILSVISGNYSCSQYGRLTEDSHIIIQKRLSVAVYCSRELSIKHSFTTITATCQALCRVSGQAVQSPLDTQNCTASSLSRYFLLDANYSVAFCPSGLLVIHQQTYVMIYDFNFRKCDRYDNHSLHKLRKMSHQAFYTPYRHYIRPCRRRQLRLFRTENVLHTGNVLSCLYRVNT